ncbi:MAG: hypothetical protein JKY92_03975 [Magnetovibrio sp.]|nr:hypothetical protein [Magnetovibrio sp.]
MPAYIVNKNAQTNGDHEVHKNGCAYMPDIANRLPLGVHASCGPAVTKAKRTFPSADGCAYCCPTCNKS